MNNITIVYLLEAAAAAFLAISSFIFFVASKSPLKATLLKVPPCMS